MFLPISGCPRTDCTLGIVFYSQFEYGVVVGLCDWCMLLVTCLSLYLIFYIYIYAIHVYTCIYVA